MHTYDYRIAIAPRASKAEALSKPIAFNCFVYGVANRQAAEDQFWAKHMVIARKNGIQRGKNQFANALTVTRIASHKILSRRRRGGS